MKNFFHPRSIAVVGASTRRGGHQIIKNLLYGYSDNIYLVNPNYKEIEAIPCFPSIENIPYSVDMAIIFVPAQAVPSVLEACARKGVFRVMIESAGFAEVGDEGRAIQNRCISIAKSAGIRIWGPNCMGLVDVPRKHFFTWMNPLNYEDGLIQDRIALIVQSGMLSAAFLADLMSRKKYGLGKVCSIGNKADVDECDLLEYLLTDTETDAIALYLESMPKGRKFAEIASKATKPIVVLMGGRSETGAQAATSHTASLAGNFRLLDSVLTMTGVTLAEDFHQMIDLARALCMMSKVASTGRTAILTFSGGAGILSCDLLEKRGLSVAQLSERTKETLASIFPDWMPVNNPVDLWPAIEQHGRISAYNRAISSVLEDPNVDVLLVHYVARLDDDLLDLEALKKKADDAGKVILFWLLGRHEATRKFHWEAQSRNIPVYWEISRAVECLSAAACFNLRERPECVVDRSVLPLRDSDQKQSSLNLAQGRFLDEYDSKHLLSEWHVPVAGEKLAYSLSEAEKAAQDMGFPLVLKGLLPDEIHKTDLGLVCLGISTEPELKDGYQRIQKKMGRRGRILIQRQVRIDYELIAGFLIDDQFGPCIMFGLGGIFAEFQPDIVFSLAPLKHSSALKLIKQIRGKRMLEGFRGMAPLKEDLMAEMLVNLGNLGTTYSQIEQIDINPVAVTAGFPLALDANIILNSKKN